MSGLLGIGLSGLKAAQAALTTSSHNISNANTAGFNRQKVIVGTQDPMFTGAGFVGQGTRVETVRRVYNEFLHNQVLAAETKHADLDSYYSQIKQIDNLLAAENAGLIPTFEGFFKGLHEVAAAPASIPSRQSLLSNTQAMIARFQSLEQRMQEVRQGVEAQMEGSVEHINMLARQIAELNLRILSTESAGPAVPANDLHDRRDALIAELNREVRVSTATQSDGTINVFIGTGQPLVIGQDTYTLSLAPSLNDGQRQALGLQLPNGSIAALPEELITGGTLGGLMRFRRESLDAAQNALGRIAVGLTETFNAQHRLGQDLNGVMGGNFFVPQTAAVQNLPDPSTGVPPTATLAVSYTNVANLTTHDYVLSYDGANYTLQRQADGSIAYSGAALPANVEGIGITVSAGAITAGDRFLIQPTRFAARNIALAITDTRLVAAGAPFRTAAAVANSGSGNISQGSVVSTTGINPTAPHVGNITLTFNSALNQFVMSGAVVGTLAYTPSADAAGKTFTLASPNISFTMSGIPNNGDVFTIGSNDSGVSDARNAVALANLQNKKTLVGGGASYGFAYSQLVSEVGSRTREAEVGAEAQKDLLDQATLAEQSQSGVNLDEEAANLLRYQQAYQASAKVMNIASRLLDEVLAIMR